MPLDPELERRIGSVTARRPRLVLDHILEHGSVTTTELRELYGLNHPPRAARDVREHGIPLVTERVVGPDGRQIARYTLGRVEDINESAQGRRLVRREIKELLLVEQESCCALCGGYYPGNLLQIDHRVPFEIEGEPTNQDDPTPFMLLCASCNTAKAKTCRECTNLISTRDPATCGTCLLASPDHFEHLAMEPRRLLRVTWEGEDVAVFDALQLEARHEGVSIGELVRAKLKNRLKD